MSDSSAKLYALLEIQRPPVMLVLYNDSHEREALIERMALYTPGKWFRATDPDRAFGSFDETIFLTPDDEQAALATLAGKRDALEDRVAPVVVLVLRGGEALEWLKSEPALSSWIEGRDVDPDELDTIDHGAEVARFIAKTESTPEAWLTRWRAGDLPDTGSNNALASWAELLTE